jgi:cell pole-organizing protein PopZ
VQPGKADDASGRISTATAGSTMAAFAQLAAIRRERRRAHEFPVGNSPCTLEDMMREALRPMLQGWLDEKLPEIVERLVRADVSRAIGEV